MKAIAIHPIPTSFRLRRRKWAVRRAASHKRPYGGITVHAAKSIVIYDAARKRKQTDHDKQKTFWHEGTHAILMTMEHKLAYDEAFVTQFGLLLEELIRTARFEGAEE